VGVVLELGNNAAAQVSLSRLTPSGAAATYDAAALVLAATFPAAGGEFGTGALVRLAHGYAACGDAEGGPLAFADVGIVTVGRSRARVARLAPADAAAAAGAAPYARTALVLATPRPARAAAATPLRDGDLVREAPGQEAPSGLLSMGAVGVVTMPPPGAAVDDATLYVQLLVAQPPEWFYDLSALERTSRHEPGRVSNEPPPPAALRVGQFVRLVPGVAQIRSSAGLVTLPHEDDDADAADSAAASWLRPGELAVVTRVRGRRERVSARRVGSIATCDYAPGALAPADAPAPLTAGDRVVLCPGYTGPLPSQARGARLEREHVGVVASLSGPAAARRLRVAAPDGHVRTYRAGALERAQLPRQVPAPVTPPCSVLLEVHGHPLGARAAVWPFMQRYDGYCDVCGSDAERASAARCTAGCGFDVCAPCLRALVASLPNGDAVAALDGEEITAERVLTAVAPAGALAAAPAGTPLLSPAPSATAAQPRTALHELPLTRGDIVTLANGYERYGDAADGPLRPGLRGRVTRIMAREALSVRVVLESADPACDDADDDGEDVANWYYMRAALALVPPAAPPHGRASAVPMLVALAAVRFSAARSAGRAPQSPQLAGASSSGGGGLVPARSVGGGASSQPGTSRSRNAWSFIDGPAADGGGAAAAAVFEQDAPATVVAALRSRIVACALHGAAPPDEEEDAKGSAATAVGTADSDAESEQELESGGESGDEEGGGRRGHAAELETFKEVHVRRDAVVASSMAALGAIGGDSWKHPTHVSFSATSGARQEEGSDAGGLTREWYSVTARALMELPVICPTVRVLAEPCTFALLLVH
jgi:hypothetical protein